MKPLMNRLIGNFCLFGLLASVALAEPERRFEFSYEIVDTQFPAGQAVDLYLPLPRASAVQEVLVSDYDSSHPGRLVNEVEYGNTVYHIHRPADDSSLITARMHWQVVRKPRSDAPPDAIQESDQQRFLSSNKLVPVNHEILQPILEEIRQGLAEGGRSNTPESQARAIYDWVVDNVEYKKVGTGWGNGDTFWACNERYGNCTDFHALYIALARSMGIPARFEIGFSVPLNKAKGSIGGYHCWVQFYLPGRGWVPIDASEAAKHPELREYYYGSHPTDRIHFTTGRDLVVSDATKKAPLNYFIYPHIEVGGQPWSEKVETRFSYNAVN